MQKTINKRRKSNGTDDRSNWGNVNDASEFGAPKGLLQQSQSNSSKIRGPPSGGFFIGTHYGTCLSHNRGTYEKTDLNTFHAININLNILSDQ